MKRAAIAIVLVWGVAALTTPAAAQMPAEALGTPLPNPSLPVGTMTVRVFNGTPTEPLDALVVTIKNQDGKERNARTDAKGRATFSGLSPDSTWVATIVVSGDGDNTDNTKDQTAESKPVQIPKQGGVQVLLSPVPWKAAQAAGPAGDKRPDPSTMSSRARPERTTPPGSLRVRLIGGSWDKIIRGHPVHLVGLRADGELIHKTALTDGAGRASFTNLRGRDVAYYALAMVPGPHGDERLMSEPVQLMPGAGMVMVLSGSGPGATVAEDDLNQLYRDQLPRPGAGEVEIRVGGYSAILDAVKEIELVEVSNPKVVAKGTVRAADTMVIGEFVVNGQANEKQSVGHARIGVLRSTKGAPPVKGITVELRQSPDPAKPGQVFEPLMVSTDERGLAEFDNLTPGVEYTPTVVIFEHRIAGEPFTMPEKGGLLSAASVAWESNTKMATFAALPWGPEKIYVARVRLGKRVHFTAPFQITKEIGAIVPLQLVPPPPLRFHLGGFVTDEFLHMEGTLMMDNGPFAPYSYGDNVFIPLPRGFIGARVDEKFATRVKVLKGRGLEWKGAVPPGGIRFQVSFSMLIDDGKTRFDWDLPYGAVDSNLRFRYSEGMEFQVKGRAEGKLIEMRNGTPIYEMKNINIPANRSMVMRVTGMPHHPAWNSWVKLGVGLMVLLLLGTAIAGIFLGRSAQGVTASEERRVRRIRLLDELADLERKHASGGVSEAKYGKQKRRLHTQLEPLYEAPTGSGTAASRGSDGT